jgi:hypothetical protein
MDFGFPIFRIFITKIIGTSKQLAMRKITVFLSLLFIIGFLLSTPVNGQEVLDNQEVINLVESGLPSSIIVKKIKSSPNRFDLSTDALIELSQNNVPEEIITAMMESEGNAVSDNFEMLNMFDDPGIYFVKGESIDEGMTFMAPSVIDKVKEGSFGQHMARSVTAAAKTKVKAIVASPTANYKLSSQPEFYFYFGDSEQPVVEKQQPQNQTDQTMAMIQAMQQMSMTGGGQQVEFQSIASPNEMRLVKTDVKKNERLFVASQASGMTRESGIDSDYVVVFNYEQAAKGLYRVYFTEPLKKGEYLFIYAGTALFPGQHIFDFTVE